MNDHLRTLSKVAKDLSKLSSLRGPLIIRARNDGATWEQIATALGMSRAGVIKLANASTEQGDVQSPG